MKVYIVWALDVSFLDIDSVYKDKTKAYKRLSELDKSDVNQLCTYGVGEYEICD